MEWLANNWLIVGGIALLTLFLLRRGHGLGGGHHARGRGSRRHGGGCH